MILFVTYEIGIAEWCTLVINWVVSREKEKDEHIRKDEPALEILKQRRNQSDGKNHGVHFKTPRL